MKNVHGGSAYSLGESGIIHHTACSQDAVDETCEGDCFGARIARGYFGCDNRVLNRGFVICAPAAEEFSKFRRNFGLLAGGRASGTNQRPPFPLGGRFRR
jgi:hypothetical protein